MIIALMGNDASGKSSVAEKLAEKLERTWSVKHIPEFSFSLLNAARKLRGKTDEAPDKPTATKHHSPLVPYLIWVQMLIDNLKFSIFDRKKIVLQDRCHYDHLATWRELELSNGFIEFLYLKLLPRPSQTFMLTVEPEVAVARRSKQGDGRAPKPLDFYILKSGIYGTFAKQKGIYEIANNDDIETVVEKIASIIDTRQRIKKLKTIAVSGLDGAGKSTTIANLSTELQKMNISHRTNHFYYNYSILKLIRLIRPDKTTEAEKHQKSLDTETKVKAKGKSKNWMLFVLADAYLQYYWNRLLGMGRVVIFDRFFHDYLVSFKFIKLDHDPDKLVRMFPTPDRYFLLVAGHAILHSRKPEHTIEFFEYCHSEYEKLEARIKITEIDTAKNNEREVLDKLLAAL